MIFARGLVLVLLMMVSASTGFGWLLFRLKHLINPLEKVFALCVCVAGTNKEPSLRRSSSEISILVWYRMYIIKWKKVYICSVWCRLYISVSGLCMICQSKV